MARVRVSTDLARSASVRLPSDASGMVTSIVAPNPRGAIGGRGDGGGSGGGGGGNGGEGGGGRGGGSKPISKLPITPRHGSHGRVCMQLGGPSSRMTAVLWTGSYLTAPVVRRRRPTYSLECVKGPPVMRRRRVSLCPQGMEGGIGGEGGMAGGAGGFAGAAAGLVGRPALLLVQQLQVARRLLRPRRPPLPEVGARPRPLLRKSSILRETTLQIVVVVLVVVSRNG